MSSLSLFSVYLSGASLILLLTAGESFLSICICICMCVCVCVCAECVFDVLFVRAVCVLQLFDFLFKLCV